MGRTVSAVVTWGDTCLGVIGPFPVSVPWWAEVEPVVAHLREVLDVPVLVLRLLRSPWARLDGLNEMLTWASDTLAAAGRPMAGAAEQHRTWNPAALFRLPTGKGQVLLDAAEGHDGPAAGSQVCGIIGPCGNPCHGQVP